MSGSPGDTNTRRCENYKVYFKKFAYLKKFVMIVYIQKGAKVAYNDKFLALFSK
jgi:hypothetical protein